MIDTDKPQTWFIQVAFDDVYHTHALLIQGTLPETLKKVRYLSQRTGCLASIYALEKAQVSPGADHIYKAMSEEGMLLREVARVSYDYASWMRSFEGHFRELPQEQHLSELQNFRQRLDKEIAALMMLADKVLQPQQIETSSPSAPQLPGPTEGSGNNQRHNEQKETTDERTGTSRMAVAEVAEPTTGV